MLTPFKLPDNGIPIKVGDRSYIYEDVYHPIEWYGGDPYRPRVEMLVLSEDGNKIFLRLNDKGGYRIPGGSIDNDSTYLQQAENETNEEALLKVKNTKFTGITYHQPMDKDYIKKGGDTPLAYVGAITYVYTSFIDGKVDKSSIEEKDLDDDMATHGKFYYIQSVLEILRTYHIEALLKDDALPMDSFIKSHLYKELDKRQTQTDKTPMFEVRGVDPYIYHGSIHKFDVFYPMSLDLGNGQQKPGWSTFCFSDYRLARRFALMRLLQKQLEKYKDEGKNYVCNWDLYAEKPYLHKDVYEEIKDSIMGQSFYVYAVDGSRLELGFGNDVRFPEVTFRESGVTPESIDRITVTSDLIFQDCLLIHKMDIPTYEKNLNANLSAYHRGWLSCMLNRNYSEDSAIAKLTKAVSDGKLNPGDDVEAYMKEHHIVMKDISFIERLPEVTKTTVQDAFDITTDFEEEWILGDNRVLFTSEKKKGFNLALVNREMLPDLSMLDGMNPVTFHKGYLYLLEDGNLRNLGLVDATYCDTDKDNVVVRLFIEPIYRRKGVGTVLLRDTFCRIVSPTGEPYHALMACSNHLLEKIPKLKSWAEKMFGLSEIGIKEQYTLFQSAQRGLMRGDVMEACKNIDEARKFVWEVGKLAKKYDANYFIVTDGASGTSNKGNPAVKHSRDSQIAWEKKHGFDPDEDWSGAMESERPSEVDLTKFCYYHAEPVRGGFNPNSAGGWDEELYSKTIEYAIRNDCNNIKESNFEAHLFTADTELSAVYLGKISVRRFDDGKFDWEWAEQREIRPNYVEYLREEQRKGLSITEQVTVYDVVDLTKSYGNVDDIVAESLSENADLEPIFIVCSFTGTPFGKLIQKFQHCKFSHAGIAFDTKLKDIFTFNMRTELETKERPGKDPVVKKKVAGGAYVESIDDYIKFGEGGDCDLCILCIFVSRSIKESIQQGIQKIFSQIDKTRYAVGNVLNIVINRSVETGNSMKMICSQFVDRILRIGNINLIDKSNNLVSPNDFLLAQKKNDKIFALYDGKGSKYDPKKTERMVRQIKNDPSRGNIRIAPPEESYFLTESVLKSSLDPKFKRKGTLYLSSFRKVRLTQSFVNSFKEKNYKLMRYINDVNWLGIGYAWLDGKELVCYVTVDKEGWITSLEVTPNYQGYGISEELIKYAIQLGGTRLSVFDDNYVAKHTYEKCGFKEVPSEAIHGDSQKHTIYMTCDKTILKSIQESIENYDVRIMSDDFILLQESWFETKYDPHHKPKGHLYLSSFKKVPMNRTFIDKYKNKDRMVKYAEATDRGYAWLDGDVLVGVVAVKPHADGRCNWIVTLGVSKDYQGCGLGEQLLRFAVTTLKGNALSVAYDNEVAIRMYKKQGFVISKKSQEMVDKERRRVYYMFLPSVLEESVFCEILESISKENFSIGTQGDFSEYVKYADLDAAMREVVEESVIFNKDNFCYNVDKFESGESNVLLVTGLSGSGKSTIATKIAKEVHAEVIELDVFEHCYGFNDDNLKQAGEVFYEYLSKHPSLWESLKKKEIHGKELEKEIGKFVHFVLSWCKTRKETKWVVEGVQIYSFLTADEVKRYPLIIMGTSAKNSVLQRFKRNGNGKIEWGKELKNEFLNLVAWYWGEERSLKQFRKGMNGVMETVVLEAEEDGDGLPSLGRDDNTSDYTKDAEPTEEEDDNGNDGDNESEGADIPELEEDTEDYTEDAEPSEDNDNSEEEDTPNNTSDEPMDNTGTEEKDSQTTNNTIKNYQILRNFESLYRLANEISETLEPILMEKPIQNRVLVQVRENLSAIKKAIIDYITIHFNPKEYPKNLYYYEVYFEALKKNVEILEKNKLFSKVSDKSNKKQKKTGGK